MRALLALAVLTLGCSRSRNPPPSGLQLAVDGLAAEGACAREIPSQWSPSWPVPVVEGGGLAYRLFFFGRDGDLKKGFRFHQAEGDAEFTPSGKVLSCSRRARPGEPLPTESAAGETLSAALEKERKLYFSTEDVAALFVAGKPLADEEKKRVADFSAVFCGLAETGHAAAYRALNPAFWAWVEANGGRAPGP